MRNQQVQAVYLDAGTNLFYFTGMKWNSSERMVGTILFQNGIVHFISPKTVKTHIKNIYNKVNVNKRIDLKVKTGLVNF